MNIRGAYPKKRSERNGSSQARRAIDSTPILVPNMDLIIESANVMIPALSQS